jgi:anti-sigma B factor antagonist
MANPFSVERSATGDITLLSLSGFLDAHTAPEFEGAVESALDAGQNRLVVDGGGLTYISSAGLGVFMGFIEEFREAGGDIKICGLSDKVREIFSLLGFEELFDIVDNVEEAKARFVVSPTGKTDATDATGATDQAGEE